MGKGVELTTTKYLIHAQINANGIVEKPDVVGAVFVGSGYQFLVHGTKPPVGAEDFLLAVDNQFRTVMELVHIVFLGALIQRLNKAKALILSHIVYHGPCDDAELLVGSGENRHFAAKIPLPADGVFDRERLGEQFHRRLAGEIALVVGGGSVHLLEQLLQFGLVIGHQGLILCRKRQAHGDRHHPE